MKRREKRGMKRREITNVIFDESPYFTKEQYEEVLKCLTKTKRSGN